MQTITRSVTLAGDPAALTYAYETPSGRLRIYTYGTSPEITRTSAGHYTATVPLGPPGTYRERWNGPPYAASDATWTWTAAAPVGPLVIMAGSARGALVGDPAALFGRVVLGAPPP